MKKKTTNNNQKFIPVSTSTNTDTKNSYTDNNVIQSTPQPVNRQITQLQPVTTENIDENGFITVGNRCSRYKPTVGISPGEGPVADTNHIPPKTYAKIHLQPKPPKPKEQIPMDLLNMTPNNDTEDEEFGPHIPHRLDQECKEILVDQIEESKNIVGVKPISHEDLDNEAADIRANSNDNDRKDNKFINESCSNKSSYEISKR